MTQKTTTKKYESLLESFKNKGIEYYTIKVGNNVFYISDISRTTLKKVASLLESRPLQAYQIILNDIFLGGDRNVFTDPTIFASSMESVLSLITPYDMKFKKGDDDIYNITIKTGKTVKMCKIRPLDMPSFMKLYEIDDDDTIGKLEFILDALWVEGDKDIIKDNKLFLSVAPIVSELINIKHSSIKKN